MNDTAKIFVLSLASNHSPEEHFKSSYSRIAEWGEVQFSPIYLIPCRDGVGADYWNACCVLKSSSSVNDILQFLKLLEHESGRVRPSHQISLDVDLIAWGFDLSEMQFNPKKMPLAADVKIPLFDLWGLNEFKVEHEYPVVSNV